jgi:hypothetical protein
MWTYPIALSVRMMLKRNFCCQCINVNVVDPPPQTSMSLLTFNGRTFKLPRALSGRNLIGPKSLKLQTFRKKTTCFPFYAA